MIHVLRFVQLLTVGSYGILKEVVFFDLIELLVDLCNKITMEVLS